MPRRSQLRLQTLQHPLLTKVCDSVCVCVRVLLNGAIPAQAAMASAVASLSSPPAMGVQWCVCVCVWPEKPLQSAVWWIPG